MRLVSEVADGVPCRLADLDGGRAEVSCPLIGKLAPNAADEGDMALNGANLGSHGVFGGGAAKVVTNQVASCVVNMEAVGGAFSIEGKGGSIDDNRCCSGS